MSISISKVFTFRNVKRKIKSIQFNHNCHPNKTCNLLIIVLENSTGWSLINVKRGNLQCVLLHLQVSNYSVFPIINNYVNQSQSGKFRCNHIVNWVNKIVITEQWHLQTERTTLLPVRSDRIFSNMCSLRRKFLILLWLSKTWRGTMGWLYRFSKNEYIIG